MSFRGRGRGRGWGGFGGFRPGKQVSWEPFPEIADLGTASGVLLKLELAKYYMKLQGYWKASPYYYEGNDATKRASLEITRFPDKTSATRPKDPLSHYIRMESEYVPAELSRGERKRGPKRVRWNPESDMGEMFEKLKKKKEDENEKTEDKDDEEEDDDGLKTDDDEISNDGDYNQNRDFDDDEDDFNMDDDGGDEPIF